MIYLYLKIIIFLVQPLFLEATIQRFPLGVRVKNSAIVCPTTHEFRVVKPKAIRLLLGVYFKKVTSSVLPIAGSWPALKIVLNFLVSYKKYCNFIVAKLNYTLLIVLPFTKSLKATSLRLFCCCKDRGLKSF